MKEQSIVSSENFGFDVERRPKDEDGEVKQWSVLFEKSSTATGQHAAEQRKKDFQAFWPRDLTIEISSIASLRFQMIFRLCKSFCRFHRHKNPSDIVLYINGCGACQLRLSVFHKYC